MASTDARPVPRKNVAFRYYFAVRKNDGTLITSWTGQDSEVDKDGAGFNDCTNEATEIGTTGVGYIDLTSTEMNADAVNLKITVTNTDALPIVVTFFPEEVGDYRANVEQFGGSNGTFSGGRPEVKLGDVAHGGSAATLLLENLQVADDTQLGNVAIGGTLAVTGAVTATNASNDLRGVVPTTASKTGYALSSTGMDAVTLPANLITATSIANNAVTAAKIADGAIDAATFAADVDAEFLSYIVDDATRIDASALNTATGTTIPAILDDTDLIDDGTSGLAKIATDVAAILVDTGTTLDGRIPAALVGGRMDATVDGTGMETGAIDAIWTRALTEAYAADGATFTGAQALYMLFAMLAEASVSGTTLTAKKLDGSTTAMSFTINDASTPTSITRSG